jgi:hypothetical protein
LFASFPEHFAGYHVLRRLSMPRHPPYTLKSLTTFIDHRHSLVTTSKPSPPSRPFDLQARHSPNTATKSLQSTRTWNHSSPDHLRQRAVGTVAVTPNLFLAEEIKCPTRSITYHCRQKRCSTTLPRSIHSGHEPRQKDLMAGGPSRNGEASQRFTSLM